ncbi:class I SAM-dependent methyltransferase [Mycobacterium koreense]|uniref:S-adenosyl-L-methionine-dependent methyltransferase n=1 Tax=Mycolicibacillus koreensis TaxID=1069220 RepID=A0A7I7SDW6_9MYCO|nr:class I SAM-dependent methyltransferase [Mycolicibacillus koreensis]MCV7248053.1 class I SAM-dependent methyltransferase [Mycolicibacillus koreensis]OSC35820.1 SAM-dependent methyltransferase [Mycolicibacillus koreensis]BBY54988.1 putative S-adenosyl-L-methionine-dependent methyltransferase [Mycolicibacillus koreensis]
MARTDDDTWDLASSVGSTATMIAAGRAMATRDPRGLIDDPLAAPLVRAVGVDFFTRLMDGELDLAAVEEGAADRMQAMVDGVALRTKFFDDYFLAATATGVRQAVILAAGLDARAYRLAWPAGTTVYEIDQPAVIEFKTRTLADLGAEPTATRRTVAIDLREDWPAALRAAGFDPEEPTAWVAEGLLIYLPPEAQDRLFDNITALSAPGSTIATEYVPGLKDFDPEKARAASERFREHGFDLDMGDLIFTGERHHGAEYLREHGWTMNELSRAELFARHDIPLPSLEDTDDPLGEIIYLDGTLSA